MLIASQVTNIFSVASLVIAALGVLYAIRQRNDAGRARAEARQLRERQQAEKVSAWAEKRSVEGRWVLAHNASEGVVRDVEAWLITPKSPAPGDRAPERDPTMRCAVLEAGRTLRHLIPADRMRGPPPAHRPAVVLAFTDAEGREWLRTANGQLIPKSTAEFGVRP